MDVDAIVFTVADRVTMGMLAEADVLIVVVVAIAMNMLVKLVLAATTGSIAFAVRLLMSFLVMIAASVLGIVIVSAVRAAI